MNTLGKPVTLQSMNSSRFFAVLLCVLSFLLNARSLPCAYAEDHDLQQWSVVTLQAPLPKKLKLYAEVQPRLGEHFSEMDRLIIRPAIGYQVNKNLSLWQGYAWTPGFSPEFRNENRIYQQILLDNQIKKLEITNRTRIEERFIEDADNTAVRFRHMLRLSYPIKSSKWYVAAYDELFWNANDAHAGLKAGFDQNRLFAGIGRKFNPHIALEGGYIFNYVNRPSIPDRINHIIVVTANFRL